MLAPHLDRHKGSLGRASWQQQLADALTDPTELAAQLGLDDVAVRRAAEGFGFRATRYYLSLVRPGDVDDPLLRQVLPHPDELVSPPDGYSSDAVGDLDPAHHRAPGLVHKYPGRALVVTTGLCAVNCRFCFRREFPYEETRGGLGAAFDVVEGDPSIREVILSGGDPLTLTDGALGRLVERVASIGHVKRLRIHTRMPVVLPDRVTPELVRLLRRTRLRPWVVTHFNHPRELTSVARAACARLIDAGVPVLNQAVLLRGVNDDGEVLAELSEGLADAGIKPYYLHAADRVRGTAHFEVAQSRAVRLVRELGNRVTGVALPSFVRDVPGRLSKTSVVGLFLALLFGCSAPEPDVLELSLDEVSADDVVPPEKVTPEEAAPPLGPVDHVLSADLDGDGSPELLAASGNDVRWGTWPQGSPVPLWEGRYQGTGALQRWLAADLDHDGREEVIAAFGVGRGFADAPLSVVLLDRNGGSTMAAPIWRRTSERNQVTALALWPQEPPAASMIYVAAFEDRFFVQGGLLSLDGGEPRWLDGHRLRMGMARAVGDFDGDGKQEVAIGRLYGDDADAQGDLRVIDDDGTVSRVPTVRGVRAVGSGDVDGDGKVELLFGDGWHKNYGEHARFRPSVARPGADGWTVELVEERADQYAVESIGVAQGRLVAGGNREVRVYDHGERGWVTVGQPRPSSVAGSWADLGGRLVTAGARVKIAE